jgi:uncharacterized SAM-binding protein YcdF (DUF218 family)
MFYFLSKAIDFLIMPFSIFLILSLAGFLSKNAKRRKILLSIAFVWLFLISNSYLVNKAFNWWEYRHTNISSIGKIYDVGIVLSGGLTGVSPEGSDHPSIGSHGDRFLQAFLLYKAGKIKKILITGTSSARLLNQGKGETRQAAELLVQWGVSSEDIILEERARNTRENALYSAGILKSKFPGGSYLLITSAFHIRRSVRCFNKSGMTVTPFATDFYGSQNQSLRDLLILDPGAIARLDLLWHEWTGYLIYKMVGYI